MLSGISLDFILQNATKVRGRVESSNGSIFFLLATKSSQLGISLPTQ